MSLFPKLSKKTHWGIVFNLGSRIQVYIIEFKVRHTSNNSTAIMSRTRPGAPPSPRPPYRLQIGRDRPSPKTCLQPTLLFLTGSTVLILWYIFTSSDPPQPQRCSMGLKRYMWPRRHATPLLHATHFLFNPTTSCVTSSFHIYLYILSKTNILRLCISSGT